MAKITFKGSPVTLRGTFVAAGAAAPDFRLVRTNLAPLTLSEFRGRCRSEEHTSELQSQR